METNLAQKQFVVDNTVQSSWDVDKMVDQVRRNLHEEVDPSTIRLTLVDILSKYEDVPIKTFVSIFACKEAVEALTSTNRSLAKG